MGNSGSIIPLAGVDSVWVQFTTTELNGVYEKSLIHVSNTQF